MFEPFSRVVPRERLSIAPEQGFEAPFSNLGLYPRNAEVSSALPEKWNTSGHK